MINYIFRKPKEISKAEEETKESLENIGKLMPEAEKKNPGLTKEILDILKWG